MVSGLSPRTRGNLAVAVAEAPRHGPIPAHAGQPACSTSAATAPGAYPRARGATSWARRNRLGRQGLSPRTRGNQQIELGLADCLGPIPAHAGQPLGRRSRTPCCRAYPRARGATVADPITSGRHGGLSPRTRGNPQWSHGENRPHGPIPAHAGQPRRPTRANRLQGAYPRARGATLQGLGAPDVRLGLSPRTRGNRHGELRHPCGHGPIPAHAGQPPTYGGRDDRRRAYPRARGATRIAREECAKRGGLSPRTRGNRPRPARLLRRAGPIPAHAGQPGACGPRGPSNRAYPRARGATTLQSGCALLILGLSPRTRGNRVNAWRRCCCAGPIPAHAGQPGAGAAASGVLGAYPRARGATSAAICKRQPQRSLSPRTRGNRHVRCRHPPLFGPIPAHAGQPPSPAASRMRRRAYPRARGATFGLELLRVGLEGPSPRTRGNRPHSDGSHSPVRPIPAHAGQPSSWTCPSFRGGAYPRARGATQELPADYPYEEGLSPRTRGNLRRYAHSSGPHGPIPAHAGQPAYSAL